MLRAGDYKLTRLEQDGGQVLYELYKLKENALENENIYGNPEVREIRDKLQTQLDAWCLSQKEPALIKWRKR
jgi:hypothetical protein